MGIRHTAVPVGAALAAVLLPRFVHDHGVPAAFFALAAANVAAGLAVWAGIHDPGSAREPPGAGPPVLRDPRLLRLAVASALLVAPQFVVTAFTVELVRAEASLSAAAAATVLAAAQLVGAAGRLIVGWWSDRLHSRLRPLRVVAYSVAAGFGLLALATHGPPALLVAAVVVVAGPAICWNGLAFTAAAELAPPGRAGTALGAQNTVNFASASVTPAVAGAVVAVTGWPVALGLFALPALVSARLIRVDARQAAGGGHGGTLPFEDIKRDHFFGRLRLR
jgi:predicted MFS family arabinose efflux permease